MELTEKQIEKLRENIKDLLNRYQLRPASSLALENIKELLKLNYNINTKRWQ